MKKDMGGAACVIALGAMIMAAKLNVRLRVLVPAVENSIDGNAFRPSDVIRSRKARRAPAAPPQLRLPKPQGRARAPAAPPQQRVPKSQGRARASRAAPATASCSRMERVASRARPLSARRRRAPPPRTPVFHIPHSSNDHA
jgi:hypothetical protein